MGLTAVAELEEGSVVECEYSFTSLLHFVHGVYWLGKGAGRRLRRSLVGEDIGVLSPAVALHRMRMRTLLLRTAHGARLLGEVLISNIALSLTPGKL